MEPVLNYGDKADYDERYEYAHQHVVQILLRAYGERDQKEEVDSNYQKKST